jgi:hypothetical protein
MQTYAVFARGTPKIPDLTSKMFSGRKIPDMGHTFPAYPAAEIES